MSFEQWWNKQEEEYGEIISCSVESSDGSLKSFKELFEEAWVAAQQDKKVEAIIEDKEFKIVGK